MKSAGHALVAPVKAVGSFVESPIQTTGNLLSGIGLMASRIGRTAEKAVTSVGDKVTSSATAEKQILKPVPPPPGTAAPRTIIGGPLGYNQQRRGGCGLAIG